MNKVLVADFAQLELLVACELAKRCSEDGYDIEDVTPTDPLFGSYSDLQWKESTIEIKEQLEEPLEEPLINPVERNYNVRLKPKKNTRPKFKRKGRH